MPAPHSPLYPLCACSQRWGFTGAAPLCVHVFTIPLQSMPLLPLMLTVATHIEDWGKSEKSKAVQNYTHQGSGMSADQTELKAHESCTFSIAPTSTAYLPEDSQQVRAAWAHGQLTRDGW